MKNMILRMYVFFVTLSVSGQTEFLGDWMVSVNSGIEAHDKRLFDYAKPEREALLRNQPEFWGTYHLGVNARRKVWQSMRFSIFLGIGAGYENATFLRPFDSGYFGESRRILLVTNKYEKIFLPLSFLAFYELGHHWLISGELASHFLVFRSVDNTSVNNSEFFPYSEGTLELDDIQLRLGVNYRIDRLLIGLHSRVANFQKIDRVIFNEIIRDPRTDKKWEWNSPLRFDLTVGYTW